MEIKDLTFDEAMEELERILDKLEEEDDTDTPEEEIQDLYKRAIDLKEYCSVLLDKERESIIKIANENDIPLDEIGLSDEDIEEGQEKIEKDSDSDEDGGTR
jgi:exodeoxyribonuclease VII small subunit